MLLSRYGVVYPSYVSCVVVDGPTPLTHDVGKHTKSCHKRIVNIYVLDTACLMGTIKGTVRRLSLTPWAPQIDSPPIGGEITQGALGALFLSEYLHYPLICATVPNYVNRTQESKRHKG
jgi:hypothetical protein